MTTKTAQTPELSPARTLIQRNLHFGVDPKKASSWSNHGTHISQFFNTFSIFLPVGERFFIDSVRHYRKQINDPTLLKEVRLFIGQEAMHSREHKAYNDALTHASLPIKQYENIILAILWVGQKFPASFQLAITLGLEHMTAILANALLEKSPLKGSDEDYHALWQWHAVEETEHKAVAHDVYITLFGDGPRAYIERISAFLLSNIVFLLVFIPMYLDVLRRTGVLFNARGWRRAWRFLFKKPGFMKSLMPQWLSYFRYKFHPWQHENAHLINDSQLLNKLMSYAK